MKKTVLIFITAVVILGVGFWIYNNNKSISPVNCDPGPCVAASIEYKNDQYGFTFSLPASWKGYSIITEKWEGFDLIQQSPKGQVISEQGPEILIRNSKWTSQAPYQDIPIMIFIINQWNDLQTDKFHIGAAPINPSELGRNNKYVFALPARYNFAYPEGFQEVEQILSTNPLHAQ